MRWCSIFLCAVLLGLSWQQAGQASPLLDRLDTFPDWHTKAPVSAAQGDLVYPDWFAGTWDVTTTLVDLVAPLAPSIVTPGFEGNRHLINQPIHFQARFLADGSPVLSSFPFPLPSWLVSKPHIVADRAFNGFNLATAPLADGEAPSPVLAVKVDPQNPNRQITLLRTSATEAPLRQLVSTITGRSTEAPHADEFVTTEVFQQEFRGAPSLYFNEVESTTAYHYIPTEVPTITAEQVTAIYLSPQDPDYFSARETPVALYRYRLEFSLKDGNTAFDQADRFFP
ncbi:MAG: hypothetical protein HC881_21260 [Leptolyngbyaceae cyanobacterium SL_7_1]|nr:hypothetical protein [Leptolyngbyaceae cyanobacterium SL_7_1]